MKEKINGTQRALRILKALKGRTMDGLSNKDLCEAIDETPVNITRATAILESEGFLRKLPTGTGRSVLPCSTWQCVMSRICRQ